MNGLPRPVMYGDAKRWALVEADALTLLGQLPSHSVDVVVTDPPYGIGIKNQAWDGTDIALAGGAGEARSESQAFSRWTSLWAAECRRILKPGGHLVAFGATRMTHRLTAGIEDAGLDIRDQLLWLYGSGVPKAMSLGDGRATALKPAYEPIVLARAPLESSLADNLAGWNTGALNIDAARIAAPDLLPASGAKSPGRWPANLVLSHDPGCKPVRCAASCPVGLLDGDEASGPSRFFYHAKASRSEREAGCDSLPEQSISLFSNSRRARRNVHPTVKPLSLMRWLIRLTCPEGGVVLDPFCGSGSTGAASLLERRGFVGIERDPNYTAIAKARIAHWAQQQGGTTNKQLLCRTGRTPHLSQPMVRSDVGRTKASLGDSQVPTTKTLGQVYHEEVETLKATGVSNAEAIRSVASKHGKNENAVRGGIHQYKARHLPGQASAARGRRRGSGAPSVDDLLGQAKQSLRDALSLFDREVDEAKTELEAAQARYDSAVAAVEGRKAEIENKLRALE